MTPLICLACSATKVPGPADMTALNRYDGPMWRTLRVALRDVVTRPEIWVLSARFGFVPATSIIPDYEQRLTPQLADRLGRLPQYEPQIFAHVVAEADRVLFAGGKLYRATMFRAAPGRLDIAQTEGLGVGYQRAQLRQWIEENCR